MDTTTAALTNCAACGARPAGYGHFALYCEPCADLPYGVAAPVPTPARTIEVTTLDAEGNVLADLFVGTITSYADAAVTRGRAAIGDPASRVRYVRRVEGKGRPSALGMLRATGSGELTVTHDHRDATTGRIVVDGRETVWAKR